MLTIPELIKDLFRSEAAKKNFRVHFPEGEMPDITNENIVQESVRFSESLSSHDVFKFGLAEASTLEFETVGIGNMYGMTIEASCEIDTSSLTAAQLAEIEDDPGDGTLVLAADSDIGYGYYRIPYGVFKIDKCPRNHGAMTHRKVTAYSKDLLGNFSAFPNNTMTSSIDVSLPGIMALVTEQGLTEGEEASILRRNNVSNAVGIMNSYYVPHDASRRRSVCLCCGTHDAPLNAMGYTAYLTATGYSTAVSYDAAKIEGFMSEGELARLRKNIADALDAAGIDFTYKTSPDTPDYANNQEAVDAVLELTKPLQFRTAFEYRNTSDSSDVVFFNPQNFNFEELTPLINDKETAAFKYTGVRTISSGKTNYTNTRSRYFPLLTKEDSLFLRVWRGDGPVTDIDLPPLTEDLKITKIRRYTVDNPAPYITIESAGSTKISKTSTGGSGTPWTIEALRYYYPKHGGLADIFKGGLELSAMFYKDNRNGVGEVLRLDNSSPLTLSPEDYAEMWWDEYDVEPIGTVAITYQEPDESGSGEENATEIYIGDGASRYDMRDNNALKNMSAADQSSITDLILNSFAPYVDAVRFTPTELQMRGYPWIEAGDALEIEAADETLVKTYALQIELSGVQRLEMDVISQGGEIIQNEATEEEES